MSKAFLYGVGGGGGSPNLFEKTFTANGTYNATDEGYDGYNPVTVNVSVTPPTHTGYVRPTGVPNGEDIIANAPDIEQGGVTYKPIYYLCAMDTFNSNTFTKTGTGVSTGADAYVFSDEPSTLYVGTSVAHTFDATADYPTSEEWNCRYIIMYATAANKALYTTVNLYNYRATFEMIGASGTIFNSYITLFGYSSATSACKSIKYVDISACSFYDNTISAPYFMGNNQALKEIKLPESITTVSSNYFCYYCYSLTALSLPSLSTCWEGFCQNCYSLTSLSLPNLTTSNGNYFCQNCYSLTSLSLPNLTTVSGGYFCQNCYSLTTLSLPKLSTVSGAQFCGSCSSLTTLSLPNLTTAGSSSFCQSCHSLTSLSLPNVTSVYGGSYFCHGCYALSYVDLSAVTSLTNTVSTTLDYCRYIKLHTDFDRSGCNLTGSSGYTKSLDWLNNELPTKLKDNSSGTAKTMTLGAANIALIGSAAAAIIAAKNWTIA